MYGPKESYGQRTSLYRKLPRGLVPPFFICYKKNPKDPALSFDLLHIYSLEEHKWVKVNKESKIKAKPVIKIFNRLCLQCIPLKFKIPVPLQEITEISYISHITELF